MAVATRAPDGNFPVDPQAAVSNAEAALKRDPKDLDALAFLGNAALQSGQFDLSLQFLGRALTLDPTDYMLRRAFGEALEMSGQLTHAETAYRQALSLKPDDGVILISLAALLAKTNRLEAAAQAASLAFDLDNRLADMALDAGIFAGMRKRIQDAAQLLGARLSALHVEAIETVAGATQIARSALYPSLPGPEVTYAEPMQTPWALYLPQAQPVRWFDPAPDWALQAAAPLVDAFSGVLKAEGEGLPALHRRIGLDRACGRPLRRGG
jgi:Flp pilus assembly protein TadD